MQSKTMKQAALRCKKSLVELSKALGEIEAMTPEQKQAWDPFGWMGYGFKIIHLQTHLISHAEELATLIEQSQIRVAQILRPLLGSSRQSFFKDFNREHFSRDAEGFWELSGVALTNVAITKDMFMANETMIRESICHSLSCRHAGRGCPYFELNLVPLQATMFASKSHLAFDDRISWPKARIHWYEKAQLFAASAISATAPNSLENVVQTNIRKDMDEDLLWQAPRTTIQVCLLVQGCIVSFVGFTCPASSLNFDNFYEIPICRLTTNTDITVQVWRHDSSDGSLYSIEYRIMVIVVEC